MENNEKEQVKYKEGYSKKGRDSEKNTGFSEAKTCRLDKTRDNSERLWNDRHKWDSQQ